MPAAETESSSPARLPWRVTERQLGRGLLGCFCGVLLFGAAALFAAPRWFGVPAQAGAPAALPLALAAAGLMVLVWGLAALLDRVQLTLDRDGVTFERRRLLGARAWSEPLEGYRGVLATTQGRGSALRYVITLKHGKDAAHDAVLHRAPSPAGQRAQLAGFAQLLGLPVLVPGAQAPEARNVIDAADLGKPLSVLAAEGKLKLPAVSAAPLASGPVRSLPRADGYAFRRWKGRTAIAAGLLGIAVGAVLLVALGGIDAGGASLQSLFATYSRLIVLPLGLVALLFGAQLGETLEVDPTGVRRRLVFGQRVLRETVLAADAVDTVRADRVLGVHVVSDEGAIRFAAGVPEPVLRTVADAVLATLARGTAAMGSTQIARLRRFAAAAFAAGLGPDQVHVKLSELGAPVEDVDACLHAIAEDRSLPHAGLMRAYLKLAQPAAARPAAAVVVAPPIIPPGVPRAVPRTSRPRDPLAAGLLVVGFLFLAWLAAPLVEYGARLITPWVPRPVLARLYDATRAAGQADFATAERIVQGYAGFQVPAAQGTRSILFGAARVRAKAEGRHLRVTVENLRLEKKGDVPRADYTAVGIVVAPVDARRHDQWVPAYDFSVHGTLSDDAPVFTLPEQTFVVPTMADACAGGCQARLLLQVRTGATEPFTENSPVFRIDGG
jgi:hypothetical protein